MNPPDPADVRPHSGSPEDDPKEDLKDEVFGAFLEELDIAVNAKVVVERFTAAYPEWAADFREEVGLNRLLEGIHPPRAIHSPDQFPDFRIVRWVAAGGMGVLYEAEQLSLGRRVALKVRHGNASAESRARFEREQRVLARLHQSHIIPIHVAGQSGAWQFFAMTFIDGASLHEIIAAAIRHHLATPAQPLPPLGELARQGLAQRGSPDPAAADFALSDRPVRLSTQYLRSAASILADVAEALNHAHQAHVTHRDVKPSNILVDQSGQCFVIDFGLAAYDGEADAEPVQIPPGLHRDAATRGIFGTPEYMPPERFGAPRAEMNAASDVWGLGITLYELLTLRRAFRGETVQEIRERVVDSEPAPIERLATNVPADLAAICRLAMQKRPEARYARAADFAADLRRWLRGEPTTARPARALRAAWMWSRRNKGWATAILLLLTLGSAAVALGVSYMQAEAHRAQARAELAEGRLAQEAKKAKLEARESIIQEAQRLQFVDRLGGWSDRTLAMLREAGAIRDDGRVRDLIINSLGGVDVHMKKRFERASTSVAFDAAGQRFLFGGSDDGPSDAVLWDSSTDSEHASDKKGAGPVAFAADGTPVQLVSGADGITLWDVARRSVLREFPAKEAAHATALSPGHAAASFRQEKRTKIWDAITGRLVLETDGAAEVIAFSADGALVALANDHAVSVHSLTDPKRLATLPVGPVPVRSLAFGGRKTSPALLAVGDAGGTIAIYEWATQTPVNFCRGSVRDVFAVAFNPDGTLLASAGREEGRLWDVASGKLILRFRDPHGMDFTTGIVFSPDGNQLAVSTRGIFYRPSVTVWDITADRGIRHLVGLPGAVEKLALSPDGRRLAALSQAWSVAVWDLASGERLASWPVPPGAYADNSALVFSPGGNRLAYSVSQDDRGNARLWDVETGAEVRRWTLPPGMQHQIVFDPAFDQGGPLRHFQVECQSGSELPLKLPSWKKNPRVCRVRDLNAADPSKVLFEIPDFSRHIYYSIVTPDVAPDMAQDGRLVIIDGLAGAPEEPVRRYVKAFDLATGADRWSIDSPRRDISSHLVIDPGGKFLFCPLKDGHAATLVSVADGSIVRNSAVNAYPSAVFGPADMQFRILHEGQLGGYLFDRSELSPIANFALQGVVSCALFDRTGRRLYWGGRDGMVRACDLDVVKRATPLTPR